MISTGLEQTFSYAPPVSPEQVALWQSDLDRAVPPTDHVSHLRLVWEPGDPWEPVHRWELYDCVPRGVFEASATRRRLLGCTEEENGDAVLLRDMDGPSPREDGYYDQVLGQFVQLRERNCTLLQWQLWRTAGVWGQPFWVIQGDRGGHKRWFSQAEKKALRYAKLPDEPPAPGSLPYAPFSPLVLARVMEYDRLRRLEERLGREPELRARRDIVEVARKQFLRLLADQVHDAVKDQPVDLSNVPRVDTPVYLDIERHEDAFIHRGIA